MERDDKRAEQSHTSRAIASRFARAALVYFLIVGVLGTWLRARFIGLLPAALQPADVIHAHSHVAYFGWASLAMFAGIYYVLPNLTGRSLVGVPFMRWQLRLAHVATVGALITFATGGYTPASIVFSTLNVLIWYGFVSVYLRNVAGMPRPLPVPLRYLHVAVVLLVLSSLGTWLISAVTAMGLKDPLWQAAGLYVFLNNFTDGWLLIGLLGLVAFVLSPVASEALPAVAFEKRSSSVAGGVGVARRGEWAAGPLVWLAVLTPLAFFADLTSAGLSAVPATIGIVARTTLAVPYSWYLFHAVRAYHQYAAVSPHAAANRAAGAFMLVASLFFVGKIIVHAGSVLATFVTSRQLFIAYLHLNLLGFFSCGLIGILYVFAARRHRAPSNPVDYRSSGTAAGPRISVAPMASPTPSRPPTSVASPTSQESLGSGQSLISLGVVGAYVLAVGVAGMVLALMGVAVAAAELLPNAQAGTVERLLQAAFMFAVVSLAGMVAAVIDLSRKWRDSWRQCPPRPEASR